MKNEETKTRWGYWVVLEDVNPNFKVKKLVVKPGGCLSDQKHKYRSEIWFVASGQGKVILQNENEEASIKKLSVNKTVHIDAGSWHQLINDSVTDDLVIYEIQYGPKCDESDIIRR